MALLRPCRAIASAISEEVRSSCGAWSFPRAERRWIAKGRQHGPMRGSQQVVDCTGRGLWRIGRGQGASVEGALGKRVWYTRTAWVALHGTCETNGSSTTSIGAPSLLLSISSINFV